MIAYADLIAQMTLEEKASLMSGANFWNTKELARLGIPSMMLTDGPHGLRKQGGKSDHLGLNKSIPATCFPTAATLANSWDVDLLEEVGDYLGAEAAAEEVSVLLGPGLNIKRNPLGGRNFEYFSEDPYLAGKLAASFVAGVQSRGVSACPKHFAVNSQETHRMSIDEVVDVRALYEIYLEGFRYAIVEGAAKTIMSAYNKVNGTYANENQLLLQDILRQTWEYDGLVVTDWGGNNDRVEGIKAGNALEMPSSSGITDREVVKAVQEGRLDEKILDQRVNELLTVVFDALPALGHGAAYTVQDAHEKAVQAAARSIVLLKNDGILPLGPEKVAIIGDFAGTPRYQGAGSSLVNPTMLTTSTEALAQAGLNVIGFAPGFKRLGGPSARLRARAIDLAATADTVLLFLGLDEAAEAEGLDRSHMRLADNQLALLAELVALESRIVLVISGGAPVEMPFADSDAVAAIVHAYLPGQGGAEAITKVLTGEVNPSGKLAESYPLRYQDVPSASYFAKGEATAEHRESIFVGYRYYDTADVPVRYPFGFGLSYTTFAYDNLQASPDGVTLQVTNTGDRTGEEIVQVYVQAPRSKVFRAKQELKGFAKVALDPGQSTTVAIDFDDHAFAYFNVDAGDWVTESGTYEVLAGASSRDIRLRVPVKIKGATVPSPYEADELPHYYSGRVQGVSATEFETLLGRTPPSPSWDRNAPLGYNDIIAQGKGRGGLGGALFHSITLGHRVLMALGKPIAANYAFFLLDLPFRSVVRMSGGAVSMEMLDGILQMVNGQFGKGLGAFIRQGYLHKKRNK